MSERTASVSRKTKETQIKLELNLDGRGQCRVDTGVGFLDHMLDHLAHHGRMNLKVEASGDLEVDMHHTVEDVAICLGRACAQALGHRKGVRRFGSASVPMEDALARVSVDLSGRPFCVYHVTYPAQKVGQFDVELLEEFLRTFTNNVGLNLHVNVPYGTNSHHIAEAIFKALGKALSDAVDLDPRRLQVPSTKGVLE